jgi:hypothetical protein
MQLNNLHSPNNNRRMSRFCLRVTLRRHYHLLNLDKLPQPRLPLLVRQITPRRANKAHIGLISLLARLDQFRRDVHFGRVCWRDDADGVCAALLQGLGHFSRSAGLVLYDFRAKFLEFFAFGGGGVEGEAGYGLYFLGEGGVGEEEFGDEVACLAVCGCDAEVPGHGLVVLKLQFWL